ncbi:hypothetical protein BwSF21_14880 [Bradyrhizobium ottawaense]|nr:hypothetical protein BwSF21_14880 [Bradyrhizobium ottawaense]
MVAAQPIDTPIEIPPTARSMELLDRAQAMNMAPKNAALQPQTFSATGFVIASRIELNRCLYSRRKIEKFDQGVLSRTTKIAPDPTPKPITEV